MTSGLASPRGLLTTVTAVATFMGVLFLPAGLLSADSSELFFTEYVEGTGTNQAVEIYNPNDMAISLSASGYMLAFYLDGGSAIGSGVPLVGTVQPGSVFVVTSANADAALLARANQHFGTDWFDGNDAVALIHGGATVDVIGQIGFDPGSAWGSGGVTTADHTLRRKAGVTSGDADGLNAFDPAAEWDAYPVDTFDGLGSIGQTANAPMSVTCPADVTTTQGMAAGGSMTGTDPDGTVTSLAVTALVPSDPATISVVDVVAAGAPGGTATGTLAVGAATPVGTYVVTVTGTNDDASPQTASCSVSVAVNPVTAASLRSMVDGFVDDGSLAASKAGLLQKRLDRIEAAVADGPAAEVTAQVRAFVNQVRGLSPRWVSPAAADALVTEAGFLVS